MIYDIHDKLGVGILLPKPQRTAGRNGLYTQLQISAKQELRRFCQVRGNIV